MIAGHPRSMYSGLVRSGGASYRITPASNVDAGAWVTRDANESSNNPVLASTGLTYSPSKATVAYGQVGFVPHHVGMHTGLSVNNALNLPTGTTARVNVGIRHTFWQRPGGRGALSRPNAPDRRAA